MDIAMDIDQKHADILAMFESVGVRPAEGDKRDLRDLMDEMYSAGLKEGVTYRTVLTNGTGNARHGGTDAESERNAGRAAGKLQRARG